MGTYYLRQDYTRIIRYIIVIYNTCTHTLLHNTQYTRTYIFTTDINIRVYHVLTCF